jgi:ribonuclease HI
MVRDDAAVMIPSEIQQVVIFTDPQEALNRIHRNGIDPGRTLVSAIIQNTLDIRSENLQLEFRRISGHAGIPGNETADRYAKEAAILENEEELPSQGDRCAFHSHPWGVLRMPNGSVQMAGLSPSVTS